MYTFLTITCLVLFTICLILGFCELGLHLKYSKKGTKKFVTDTILIVARIILIIALILSELTIFRYRDKVYDATSISSSTLPD